MDGEERSATDQAMTASPDAEAKRRSSRCPMMPLMIVARGVDEDQGGRYSQGE
jgi:hypothetical protein